ncbi:MAG: cytochrome c maturation protein CcmE [Dehalococcoidales bacterium]|nr:MAG: cytochrome c maturation protein CcmE [Dehalococcoidales bacterium]
MDAPGVHTSDGEILLKRKKFFISGVVVLAAIAYLGYVGFSISAVYYYTVSEFIEQGDSVIDQNVQVNGQVLTGSVEQEAVGRILRFSIASVDGEETVPVVYEGVVPDAFTEGNDVVIEGYLDSAGIFQAHTLKTKCPSKYVPEESDES